MRAMVSLLLLLAISSRVTHAYLANCNKADVDFIILEGDATSKAIEDDIVVDLAKVGITVNTRLLEKDAFNTAMVAGDFNMAFSESWGAPYDPNAYASSWSTKDEAYYAALKGLPPPNTQAVLTKKIKDALVKETESERQAAWTEILFAMHEQATELPFYGKRIPAVISNRLTAYVPGHQQFDYPAHTLRVVTGSRSVTVAPGAQSGLLSADTGVGRLDPHTYRPNEFFANNWVYDSLVAYGAGGAIVPALAVSWTVAGDAGGGHKYTFNLRQGVKFHDGAVWNCTVAKLNFDHVLAKPLITGDYHGWYGLMAQVKTWMCASTYVFEVVTKEKYYPFLQELSFIRPLRMMSPNMFVGGLTSDPLTQNSCHSGWGNITDSGVTVNCKGMMGGGVSNGGNVSGTGRWKYIATEKDETGKIKKIRFAVNADHWDVPLGNNYPNELVLVHYPTHDQVKEALLNGTLDAVLGGGVLTEATIASMRTSNTDKVRVVLTEVIQNRIVVLNTAKAPTDEIQMRKVIIHAIDRDAIIKKELGGLAEAVDSLFPKDAPYCGAHLTPIPDYDLEKAKLLNCPEPTVYTVTKTNEVTKEKKVLPVGAIVGFAVLGAVAIFGVGMFVTMYSRERSGKPMFAPLITHVEPKNGAEP